MKSLVMSLFSCLALLACASQPQSADTDEKIASTLEDMQLQKTEKIERIRDYRVDSWRYIDNSNLIIKAGLRDNYLVSLRVPCINLNGAFSIGFTSTTGSLDKFEDIIVRDSFGRAERCPIADIVKLEPIPDDRAEPVSGG